MEVITRSNETEPVSFDKISFRLVKLSHGLDERYVKPMKIAQETIAQMHDKITTEELDNLSADISASYGIIHPDFNKFAARICVSNLHKSTDESFLSVMKKLYQFRNSTDEHTPLISKELYELSKKYSTEIQNKLDFSRDYDFDFFGIKTLERAYLMRIKKDINNLTNNKNNIKSGKIVERPQHMWMRVSLGIHCDNIQDAFETYNYLSKMYFTHATPTLYNAGTTCQQLSSCFLQGMGDSIDGIFKTISDSAQISKRAGGIGIHISAIRASGSRIRGTNGRSDGIVPMCKVINETARYVNQGGRRKGSIAVYIEPWHADIFEFCELRKPVGSEEMRARDLFLALWIPDLFMKRVEKDGDWCLMCPDECPNLVSTYGDEFEKNYCQYEEAGRFRQKIKARELWKKILESQIETGLPYMAFKDNVNKRTNQNNVGLIRSSNLCCEIVEYSDEKEYAVCNLASIALPRFIDYKKIKGLLKIYSKSNCKYCKMAKKLLRNHKIEYEEINLDDDTKRKEFFESLNDNTINTVPQIFIDKERVGDYEELSEYLKPSYNFNMLLKISKIATRNLNKIIDINFYPVPEARLSNLRHRPIGLGVQGLADVFNIFKLSFGSKEAKDLNKRIFETIYFGSLEASNEISKERLEKMKLLNKYLNENENIKIPKLYDENLKLDNSDINKLYHELKPIEEELKDDRGDLLGSYSTFIGSNFSLGKFQFNLWGLKDEDLLMNFNWNKLRNSVVKYGTRNSLLTALMPTASTSQLLGNNECFEPYTSNLYTRSTFAGDYIVINKNLIRDLLELNLWTKELREEIIYFNGSLKNIRGLPQHIKDVYEIAYDMPQKNIVQQAIDRGPFIDQSQSMNLFMDRLPSSKKLGSSHFYSWKNGLKTGMYYLRSLPAVDAIKFGLDALSIRNIKEKYKQNNYNETESVESYDFAEQELNSELARKTDQINNGRVFEVCDTCSS